MSIYELLIILFIGTFGIAGTALWVWMLVDCAVHEPSEGNDKIVWILVIALTNWIGALIYLIVRRPKRKALFGQ